MQKQVKIPDTNIVKVLNMVMTGPSKNIQAVITWWWQNSVFQIVNWKGVDGNKALKIDLAPLGSSGQVAYIPFGWTSIAVPSIEDSIKIIRKTVIEYPENQK